MSVYAIPGGLGVLTIGFRDPGWIRHEILFYECTTSDLERMFSVLDGSEFRYIDRYNDTFSAIRHSGLISIAIRTRTGTNTIEISIPEYKLFLECVCDTMLHGPKSYWLFDPLKQERKI